MKIKSIIILIIMSVSSMSFTTDVIDDIASAIRTSNPKNISKYFIDNIEMKIIDKEQVYSKQQAEMILKDFFGKHPVKKFTIAHKSEPKNGSQYVIGQLETSKGKYRTFFLIKTTGDKTLVQQFKIENE